MTDKKTKPSNRELNEADLDKVQGGSKGGNVETTWKVEEGEGSTAPASFGTEARPPKGGRRKF